MQFPELTDASIWIRLLAATMAFIALLGGAAMSFVGAMLMVLLNADATWTGEYEEVQFKRLRNTIGISLAVSILLPPIMLICRSSVMQSAIPAGFGFLVAALAAVRYFVTKLRSN